MAFDFATAGQIIFGNGRLKEVGPLAAGLGRRALVVSGEDILRAAPLMAYLADHGVSVVSFTVAGEPSIQLVQAGCQAARQGECDLVIGFGGGSALDAGKAIAALLTNGGEPLDYLELIGRGLPLIKPSLPYIAIPTTAGTGAEVTRNAVLYSPEHRVKVSLRSPYMLPTIALVDPMLTHSMPPDVTASTGLDALTQLLEPFVSHLANPLTDGLCREGLARAARSLRRAYEDGTDQDAREDMALASLLGGLALANAKLGAVHGFAGVIGGMFPAPHGEVCARLLPHVMAANVAALNARLPESPALARYAKAARILTGDPLAAAADGTSWVQALCRDLDIPPLSEFGISASDFPEIVAKSAKSSSMKGNPLPLSDDELTSILAAAI